MAVKAIPSLYFVKDRNESFYELLRLAQVSKDTNKQFVDEAMVIKLLNQLPLLAINHKRIIPLLNNTAHQLNIFNKLSQECQTLLTCVTQQGIVTELAKKQQLSKIITTLSAHNIPLVLLKGAAFADALYSAQAPRTSNDLDILIQEKDWKHAVTAIKSVMSYTEKSQPDVFGDLYELSFIPKSKVGAALDLHRSLIHPILFNISEKQLWNGSVEHPSFNHKLVRTLSPEHALIHQALHAYKDMDFGKYNLLDSHEIIMQLKPDMANVIAAAKEWGATTPLYVLLTNCTNIMNSDFDKDLLQQIKPSYIRCYIINKLLNSPFNQPVGNKKPLRYRLNQILGQFIFTGSIKRPLALQWLFLKSLIVLKK